MELNAFVVMPFGQKPPRGFDEHSASTDIKKDIDFDKVWTALLKPSLELAGCRAFRADSEAAAGDIRTDMFFELVTADLVIADITISNANVFYELGVRHGICPRGVFVVTGNLASGRAFDIAQDRSFAYDGNLFLNEEDINRKARAHAIKQLGSMLAQAIAADRNTVGSPVYSHLPGLVPVNWENIETSKARHFHALRDDWLDCVRKAQSEGHPGDILTLADDAPTRLHRTKILYEAAVALINMCRYPAAERVLREVIASEQNSSNAQLQLARALAHQNKTEEAEHALRSILRQHEDDPHAGDLLGQVFRHLWHLAWRGDADPQQRKEKARDTSQLANMAIASFMRALRFDARAYYAGFNALILGAIINDLFPTGGPSAVVAPVLDLRELAVVIEFVAKNERERAIEIGDYTEQFWATTTLAGVALVNDDIDTANTRIREACCIPGTTSFQLQSFRERLEILDELDFKREFVQRALGEVTAVQRTTHCTCERVVLFASDMEDAGLTASQLTDQTERIRKILDTWKVHEGDLVICEGTTHADIIFAEECLARNARVRLMILEPEPRGAAMWPFEDTEWLHRFHELTRQDSVEVWFHDKHLGSAILTASSEDDDDELMTKRRRAMRHKLWMINTAQIEAEQVNDVYNPSENRKGRLFGLFVLNGTRADDHPENPGYFIRYVNGFDGYRGEIELIRPGH